MSLLYTCTVRTANLFLKCPKQRLEFGFLNDCFHRLPLNTISLNNVRGYQTSIAHFCQVFGETENDFKPDEKSNKKKNLLGPKVNVILEDGNETSMFMNELERFAKRNNFTYEKLPTVKDKIKYKIQKKSLSQSTDKSKTRKRIRINDTISSHDLEIKINAMCKFLEKGKEVLCTIDSSHSIGKTEEVINTIVNSKLKEYYSQIDSAKSKKGNLFFKPTSNPAQKSEKNEVKASRQS